MCVCARARFYQGRFNEGARCSTGENATFGISNGTEGVTLAQTQEFPWVVNASAFSASMPRSAQEVSSTSSIAELIEIQRQESAEILRITEELDVTELLDNLENWTTTTAIELRLLSEQINFTLKVVEQSQ